MEIQTHTHTHVAKTEVKTDTGYRQYPDTEIHYLKLFSFTQNDSLDVDQTLHIINNNNSFCRVSFQWLEGTTLSFIQMQVTMQNDNNNNGTYNTLSNTCTANITTDTQINRPFIFMNNYYCNLLLFFKQEMSEVFLHGESFARVFKEECQNSNVGWNRVADSPGLELDHGITIKHTSMSAKGMKDTSVIYINI